MKDSAKVNQVIKWLAAGGTEVDIAEAIEQNYPKSNSTELIKSAMFEIVAQGKGSGRSVLNSWCLEAAREVHRKAMASNDLPASIASIKLIMQINEKMGDR